MAMTSPLEKVASVNSSAREAWPRQARLGEQIVRRLGSRRVYGMW